MASIDQQGVASALLVGTTEIRANSVAAPLASGTATLIVSPIIHGKRVSGTFTRTLTRTGTTGNCPGAIASPTDVASTHTPTTGAGSLSAPLAVGTGVATGDYNETTGGWDATGEATLPNGFVVTTRYVGTWTRNTTNHKLVFTGTVTVTHRFSGNIICTETYSVTLIGDGAPPSL